MSNAATSGRLPFDPGQRAFARRDFTASGKKFARGDVFPTEGRTRQSLRALWSAGYIDFGELRDNHEARERKREEREAQATRTALAEQAADRARTGALADLAEDEPYRPKGQTVRKPKSEAARPVG
jgi:hypothetical protein